MKETMSRHRGAAKATLRVFLLVLALLQLSILSAHANKNVYVRWGLDTGSILVQPTFDGSGGSVSSPGAVVQNGGNTAFANTATPYFTITPSAGYVISSVQWMDNDSNGFWMGLGNVLGVDGNSQVHFTMTNHDCSLQVTFKPDPNAAQNSFVAYYGTGAIDNTGQTTPNWTGGTVYREGGTTDPIGGSGYSIDTYSNSGSKSVLIVPAANYTITAVKYAEAVWTNGSPNHLTVIGTPTTVSPDGAGRFSFTATAPKSYVIFVQFTLIAAQGGNIGAWYGTNNTTGYDSPQANGSGGTVWKTSGTSQQLANRVANGVSISSNTNVTIEVRPASGFKITSIMYGDTNPTSSVAVPANQTSNLSFTFPVANGHNYVVWVVFTSTAASSFTVTGTVDPATDASCTSNTISPGSQVVNINQTGSFTLGTSSNCVIESVNFNGAGAQAWVGSGTTYTTPAITAVSSFVVKFKPIGYNILSEIDATSPSGCGTISPAGTTNVVQGASQAYTITRSANCAISHVWVTDTNKGYTSDTDIAPLTGTTYTFNNVQAAGHIKVKFTTVVPTSSDDYCQVPAFVAGQTSLVPNVLIIFDNSGSMGGSDSDGYAYYNRKTYDCTASSAAGSCSTFYGYFDPTKMYKLDTTDSNKYLIDNVTLNMSTSNGKSGNYLNYRYMHKVDVVRKVLSGGKVVNRNVTPTSDPLTHYFLATDIGKTVEYGTTLPTGMIQQLSGKVRFGLMVFNNPAEGGHLAAIPGTTRKAVLGSSEADLVAAIESSETNPVTSTPISETLYEAIRYFQAKPSAYNSGVDYGTMDPVQNTCQKHFILLLTDGEPNSNNNLPGLSTYPTMNGYTDSVFNVNTWENRIPSSDRASSSSQACTTTAGAAGPTFSSTTNSEKAEAVAFYAHNSDLRSASYNNSIEGTQNITIFPVYAFGDGTGTKTLHMIAKYGGYENKNGNNPSPNTWPSPDLQDEWDKTGTCVPYNYFEADDGAVLQDSIMTAMTTILAKVSSGTAASILSNSEGSGANMLQAVFYPNKIFENSTEVSWIGEMQNLWYYVDPFINNSTVREDSDFASTTPNHIMNLRSDYVAKFFFDNDQKTTRVALSQDTDANGTGDVSIASSIDPDAVKSIWRAGKLLWARNPSTRTIHTSVNGTSLLDYSGDTYGGFYSTRAATLRPFLQAADNDNNAEATKIINYIRGTDQTNYRNRKVSLTQTTTTPPPDLKEWKLGDIVSSTPRIQSTVKLNTFGVPQPSGYGDQSYNSFIASSNYQNRGMVYVGANDGMLHAFKLGKLAVSGAGVSGDVKATLTGSGLGDEQWAYIPRNALPYLKYFTDQNNYKHIYYVDGPTVLSDVAIGKPASCGGTTPYAECVRDNAGGTNWRSVLIGSMGLGGASKIKAESTCADGADGTCVKTPLFDSNDITTLPHLGLGYSSYFALDITNQYFNSSGTLVAQPTLKWEFSHPEMGYATSGAAIVRILPKAANGSSLKDRNGKWFAVIASGPTGPIDTVAHQFLGRSDQNLKLFVIDLGASAPLVQNQSYWVIDTGIQRAFGGSMIGSVIDTDRWNKLADGNYQDDALYVGYTKANIADTAPLTTTTAWTDGGVLRLLTKEDPDPSHWTVSKVISGIGSVTSGIAKLQDKQNKKLWLYFGTGRYYYSADDSASQRYVMGVQDRCYTTSNQIDKNCSLTTVPGSSPEATGKGGALALSDLKDQSSSIGALTSEKGWYVALNGQDVPSYLGAERCITDPVALTNGAVFFTTFAPTSDVCKFGGNSYMWGMTYDQAGTLPDAALKGKALVQVSTGSFEEVDLKSALNSNQYRKMGTPMTGKPPAPPPPVISNSDLKPVKKIVHIQER